MLGSICSDSDTARHFQPFSSRRTPFARADGPVKRSPSEFPRYVFGPFAWP